MEKNSLGTKITGGQGWKDHGPNPLKEETFDNPEEFPEKQVWLTDEFSDFSEWASNFSDHVDLDELLKDDFENTSLMVHEGFHFLLLDLK